MINRLEINGVAVNYVKSGTFRYVEQVSQEGLGLRFGSAYSSYIEGVAYYKPNGTPEINEGDVITYSQILDVDSDFVPLNGSTYTQTIGKFTVKKLVKEKHSYSFIAYDNLDALNDNFSTILYNHRNSFPMTVDAFLELVRDTALNNCSVTVDLSGCNAYNMPDPSHQLINYFYSDGLTIKDILMYVADLTLQYIKCDTNGIVRFKSYSTASDKGYIQYWKNSDRYIISPTDQASYTGTAIINGASQTVTLVPVFYKQDGLEHETYSFETSSAILTQDINGKSLWAIAYQPITNPYVIQKNILIGNMLLTSGINYLCVPGWVNLRSLTTNYSISPVEVHLFPFRNPFNAGQILPHIEDASGNRFSSVVMKMEQTDSEVIITCSGTEQYYASASENYDAEDDVTSLNVAVNELSSQINNKVSKTGDTMSGTLTVQKDTAGSSGVVIDNLANKIGDTPAQASWVYVTFRDSQGNEIGKVRSGISTSGNPMISIYTENGGNANAITLNAVSGNSAVYLSNPAAWLNALGLGASGALPITIAQGGTGATTADGVKGAFDPFRNSVSIASGTNLNDLYIPGVYYSVTSAITSSLTNCPVSGYGFSMLVLMTDTPSSASSRRVQVIPLGQYIYVRRRDTNNWTSWYRFSGTAV